MNRKKLFVIGGLKPSALHLLAVALFGLLITGGSQIHNNIVRVHAAATLVVDDDGMASASDCNASTTAYPTISAAVAAASSGDTIKVCPGPYPELVQVNQTLTILGAQAGVDARTRSVPITSESVVGAPDGAFQILADNVVIDGFTIQGVVSDPSAPPFTGLGAGIWTNPGFSGTNGGHQILNNIVQNNISGIELDSTCAASPTLVKFNLIQNNNNPGAGSGNGIQTNFGLCNATIDQNKFSGHLNSSVLVVAPSSLDVTNNELVGGTPERIVFGAVSNSTVSGNISMGSTAMNGTIRLFGGDSNVMIKSNTLLNGIRGIRVDDLGAGINSAVAAHLNCIQGNTVAGLQVDTLGHMGTLDAINNWWGSSTGPTNPNNPGGTGDAIIAPDNNVSFIPFLTSPPGPPCPAAPPANTPGKATGGGKVESSSSSTSLDAVLELATLLLTSSSSPSSVGGQATFGFSVSCCAPKGNLEYNDHGANVRIKASSFSSFVISSPSSACPTGKHAQFMGMANQNGTMVNFTVDVDDCGEPGSSDRFKIQTSGGYMADGTLIGGNIQIH